MKWTSITPKIRNYCLIACLGGAALPGWAAPKSFPTGADFNEFKNQVDGCAYVHNLSKDVRTPVEPVNLAHIVEVRPGQRGPSELARLSEAQLRYVFLAIAINNKGSFPSLLKRKALGQKGCTDLKMPLNTSLIQLEYLASFIRPYTGYLLAKERIRNAPVVRTRPWSAEQPEPYEHTSYIAYDSIVKAWYKSYRK